MTNGDLQVLPPTFRSDSIPLPLLLIVPYGLRAYTDKLRSWYGSPEQLPAAAILGDIEYIEDGGLVLPEEYIGQLEELVALYTLSDIRFVLPTSAFPRLIRFGTPDELDRRPRPVVNQFTDPDAVVFTLCVNALGLRAVFPFEFSTGKDF